MPVREGWGVATAFLQHPAVRLVTAGAGHAAIAAELAQTPGLRSDDVPDVEIAALAIEHGLVLATHDHGFRRFSRLRVVDPLTSGGASLRAGKPLPTGVHLAAGSPAPGGRSDVLPRCGAAGA